MTFAHDVSMVELDIGDLVSADPVGIDDCSWPPIDIIVADVLSPSPSQSIEEEGSIARLSVWLFGRGVAHDYSMVERFTPHSTQTGSGWLRDSLRCLQRASRVDVKHMTGAAP
jgi:hypothetical protein